jgi:pimeloyl-ACP methyl ester carboxylesterase
VAWHVALLRPDRVRGVVALSVPWRPRGSAPPVAVMRDRFGEAFYMVYFQQLGPADAELARDPRLTFRKTLYSAAGESPGTPWLVPAGGGLLDAFADPAELPGWLTEADIGYFAGQFTASGFSGGLNWYRNLDRNWELTSAWHGAPITPPALFIAGERDGVIAGPGARKAIDRMAESVPGLRGTVLLPGCGHWTQQERPAEVNEALISFADGAR